MAIGKLFRTILFVSILAPSSVYAQTSAGDSVTGPFEPGNNYISFLVNLFNYRGGMLDSNDRQIYQQSLMVMLDNIPVGQTIEWRSNKNSGVRGQMRVVYGYQTSNGYCRVYQSEVYKDDGAKSWQEYACRSEDQPQWKFYNK